jgi:hypothetical protein
MKDISTMWNVDPQTFLILGAVVSFAVLGIVQALKGKVGKLPTRWLAFIACVVCSTMQIEAVPKVLTGIFNLMTCSFSFVTLLSQLGITIKGAALGNSDAIQKAVGIAVEQAIAASPGILQKAVK